MGVLAYIPKPQQGELLRKSFVDETAVGISRCSGKLIAALVFRMARMALYPNELYGVGIFRGKKPFP